jgi:crotonobetainyl-CoA:carnitine CoA-transferase CaiB-like acyl-CoA transferase
VVAVVRPFGLTGPYAEFEATHLNAWHSSAYGWMTRQKVDDDLGPPLKGAGYIADYIAGVHIAGAALAAIHERHRSGRGQIAEVSEQEVMLSAGYIPVGFYFNDPEGLKVPGAEPPLVGAMHPCKDGQVLVTLFNEPQWEGMIRLMGNPDWAAGDWWRDAEARRLNLDYFDDRVEEWLLPQLKDEVVDACQEAHLPAAALATPQDLANDTQLAARGFFEEAPDALLGTLPQPGLSFRLHDVDAPTAARYPELEPDVAAVVADFTRPRDEASRTTTPPSTNARGAGPLAGLRVADFSWAWAGPYLAGMLSDLGAEVVKVESNARVDQMRINPPIQDGIPGNDRASGHYWANRGKRSVSLNLKEPRARELALDLIAASDIVVENFSPGAMDRLGLGYEAARAVRPDIIYASLSGFGATGPRRGWVSYGMQLSLQAGLTGLTGTPERDPAYMRVPIPDPAGGALGAFAIMCALEARTRTGEGCRLDISQMETTAGLLPEALLDQLVNGNTHARIGNADPDMAPHGVYPCAGYEQWAAIAITSDDAWARFVAAIGNPRWALDPRFATLAGRREGATIIEAGIAAWTEGQPREAVVARLQAAGIAATPVLSLGDLFTDPHLAERRYYVELEAREGGTIVASGINWRFWRTPGAVQGTGPRIGEHNDHVLHGILGLSEAQVAEATAAGAIG